VRDEEESVVRTTGGSVRRVQHQSLDDLLEAALLVAVAASNARAVVTALAQRAHIG
jgi:hypothetical protein